MRIHVTALIVGAAALAVTTLSPVLGNLGGGLFSDTAQAAENHNSSRSNRSHSAPQGNSGNNDRPSVGVKEERSKK